MNSRTRSVVLCGLSIALLAVGAAIVVPFGPVPFTAQTLVLTLIMLVLTPKEAVIAVAGYLVLGAIGLPIFSAFRGGPGVLFGPTGGFLIGFLVAMLLSWLLKTVLPAKISDPKVAGIKAYLALDIVTIVLVIIAYHGFGLAWFTFWSGTTFIAAFSICTLPFLVPDAIKSAVAFSFAQPIRIALGRAPMRKPATEAEPTEQAI
jgi:biotin transport system substrate-specific component